MKTKNATVCRETQAEFKKYLEALTENVNGITDGSKPGFVFHWVDHSMGFSTVTYLHKSEEGWNVLVNSLTGYCYVKLPGLYTDAATLLSEKYRNIDGGLTSLLKLSEFTTNIDYKVVKPLISWLLSCELTSHCYLTDKTILKSEFYTNLVETYKSKASIEITTNLTLSILSEVNVPQIYGKLHRLSASGELVTVVKASLIDNFRMLLTRVQIMLAPNNVKEMSRILFIND